MHVLILIVSLIVMAIVISAEVYVLATAHIAWPAGGQRLCESHRTLVREKLLGWRNLAFFATTVLIAWATEQAKALFMLTALVAFVFFVANLAAASSNGAFNTQALDDAKQSQSSPASLALPVFGSFLKLYAFVFLFDVIAVIAYSLL